jgi:hypothetical protein
LADQPFIGDYVILLFFAALGTLQIAAAVNGLRGLLFFHHRLASLALGAALIIGAATWFFLSEPRNVPDFTRGMNGNEQFLGFCLGVIGAFAFTALASALLHPSLGAGSASLSEGLEGLRESHYPRLLYRALGPACRRLCSR